MPAIAELSVADWNRLNRLLAAALGLEPEARSAWLRKLPAREADLLPLLEQLLSLARIGEISVQAAPHACRPLDRATAMNDTQQRGQVHD